MPSSHLLNEEESNLFITLEAPNYCQRQKEEGEEEEEGNLPNWLIKRKQ